MHTTKGSVSFSLLVVLALMLSPVPALALRSGTGNCQPITALPALITEGGVYCFTGNLSTATTRGIAIRISADNVVLDLNGFILDGLAADRRTTTTLGIFAGGQHNITIRNGTIRGFYYGITMAFVSGATVENIRADQNTFVGVQVSGSGTVIRNNQIVATGGSAAIATIFGPASAYGILVSGLAPRVLNNDVTGIESQGSGMAVGIFLVLVVGGLVVNNRIALVDWGIEYSTSFGVSDGKYRDNLTVSVTTPFLGGTDAGNNN